MEQKLSENTFDNKQLLSEVNVFFPAISSISVSKQNIASLDSTKTYTVLLYTSNPKLFETDKDKLKNWMYKKLGVDTIIITETEK